LESLSIKKQFDSFKSIIKCIKKWNQILALVASPQTANTVRIVQVPTHETIGGDTLFKKTNIESNEIALPCQLHNPLVFL